VTEPAPRVVVVTVPGCHLCEMALRTVTDTCEPAAVSWAEQDLFSLDDDAVRRWRELVPVVLVDGDVVDALRVDPVRLRQALQLLP